MCRGHGRIVAAGNQVLTEAATIRWLMPVQLKARCQKVKLLHGHPPCTHGARSAGSSRCGGFRSGLFFLYNFGLRHHHGTHDVAAGRVR